MKSQTCCRRAGDAGRGEGVVRGFHGTGEADSPGEVFEDDGFEAKMFAVEGGEADAEVVGEAGEEEAFEAALPEVAGQAGGGGVVVFEEGGVAVDVAAEAFAEDEFGVGDFQGGVEGGAGSVLEAVIGPEGLGAVRGFDLLVGIFGVGAGEGDMLRGVPVLGEEDVIEAAGEGVDGGEDLVAAGYGEGAAGHEIGLEVDEEECVGLVIDLHGLSRARCGDDFADERLKGGFCGIDDQGAAEHVIGFGEEGFVFAEEGDEGLA
jgi:hypothetical protein